MKKYKNPQLIAIGGRIRLLRKEKGFSQEDFAALANLDRSYYGGVERGERNLSTLIIIRIASALNMNVGEMFPPISDLLELQDRNHKKNNKL